ncbi:MAG: response regulator [Lachnospiraceae bacterium]|nr:response regulator [Lachnospiraceae bacterium]
MNAIVILHGIGSIIGFMLMVLVFKAKPSEQQKILFAGTVFTFMDVLGYFFELQSRSLEVTRLAVKMEYIGTTMGLLAFLFFTCLYSNHLHDKWIKLIKYFYIVNNTSILFMVLIMDYHTYFYKTMDFSIKDGLYLMIYEPGILHYWWTITITIMGILIAAIMIQSVLEHKGEKRPELILICAASLVPIGIWILRMTGVFGDYDSYPLSMLLTESFLVLVMYRYRLFDTVKSAKDRVIDEIKEGILVVNGRGSLVYSNPEVGTVFPDIEWDNKDMVDEQVFRFMETHIDGFIIKDRFYKWQSNDIFDDQQRKAGVLYRIFDMTDNYLYTKQLIELKEDAERANEAKSSFLARMSHEIRTPINAVLGMNEMILREAETDNIREYATNIHSAGKLLLSIINDILDLSKIESSKMEIVENDYNVGTLLLDIENMVSLRAEEKGLNFKIEPDVNMPKMLRGDEKRIKQCITNLLTNSVKYTQEGSVTLQIDCVDNKDSTVYLWVSVSDTGIGIKEDELYLLFDPFIRLDMRKNKNIEGTGLGLSITKRLLEMMGGNLTVESIYGKGSTFSFVVPQKVIGTELLGDYKKIADESEVADSAARKAFVAPNAQILAVDDTRVNITVVKGLLKRLKVQFDSALSGQECLNKVKEKHYDIILLDHMMPEMDGIETLHNMQQMDEYNRDKSVVIALTANAIVGAKEEYLKEGFADYLSKPIDSAQLEEMIRQYLPDELIEYI